MFGISQVVMIGAIILLFGSSMLNATQTGLSCGASGLSNCGDFIHTVGGALLSPSQRISDSITQLKAIPDIKSGLGNSAAVNEITDGYKGYLKDQIISNLLMLLLMVYIVYWILGKIERSKDHDSTKAFAMIVISFVIVAVLQILYSWLVLQHVEIPYKGLYDLAANFGLLTA